MINLAVFNLKDILRYFIKIAAVIILLWLFSSLVNILKKNQDLPDLNLGKVNLNVILEHNIPGMLQLNKKNEITEEKILDTNKFNLSDYIFKMQLAMIYSTKNKKEVEVAESNNAKLEQNPIISKAQTGLKTEVVPNNVPNNFTNTYDTVQIKNGTSYNLTLEMLKPDIEVNNKSIIIFHTHTCESDTPTEEFNYIETGTYRTTDLNYSVARVGDELENQLKSYNYNVIHDKTYHDYPSYTGSYDRSLNTVRNILASNQDTDVIIDLHRDAIADYSYAPTVKIGDEYAAQLMFVIGSDGGGLEHPNWQENLKFAVKIQEKANELYPGLFKPIILRNSRYNQHLAKGACIIEVGATGNTMEQCLISMKYLAKVVSEVVK